jgi:uncharacterized LabA/DUF88 family protein
MHNGQIVSGDYSKIIEEISPSHDNTVLCVAAIASPIDDITSYSNTLKMHNFLRHIGFIMYTVERKNGKADGDVLLTVKSMEFASLNNYDRFILVSADGDFIPLVEHFRKRGVKVDIASVDSHISMKLKRASNNIIDLHDWAHETIDRNGNTSCLNAKEFNENALSGLVKAVDDLKLNFDDVPRRREYFHLFQRAISSSISMMNGNSMKAHRGILSTLRDCMEVFDPKSLTESDMEVIVQVLSGLKMKNPNMGLHEKIKNKLIIGSSAL